MPTFDGAEFYLLAKRLVAVDQSEAAYRTSINRAYYACHVVGIDSTSKKGWYQPAFGAGDHSGLSRALRAHNQDWHSKLTELYRLREHADYHTESSNPGAECDYCRDSAKNSNSSSLNLWTRTQTITDDILPRLKSIAPTR